MVKIKYIKKIDYATKVPLIKKKSEGINKQNVPYNPSAQRARLPRIDGHTSNIMLDYNKRGNDKYTNLSKESVAPFLPNISHKSHDKNINAMYEMYEGYVDKILQVCKVELELVGDIRNASNNSRNDEYDMYKNKIAGLLSKKKYLINSLNTSLLS